MKCPLCKSFDVNTRIKFPSAKLSGSLLYDDVIILNCNQCGHIFNELGKQDIENLEHYYKREYIDSRYTYTRMNDDFMGHEHGNNYVIISQSNINTYIDLLVQINSGKYNELWPTRDFIAIDQWLEHCWNIDAVMQYIRQTVPTGKDIYVSVPDYAGYDNIYYCLIKEHIQHFTEISLEKLFYKYGFVVKESRRSTLDILNGELKMPILEYIFTNNKPEEMDGVYCYGASREFMNVIENSDYFKSNTIDGIIDDTPSKHRKTINGIPIFSDGKVASLSDKSTIVITAYYGREKIIEKLKATGYSGNITIMGIKDV